MDGKYNEKPSEEIKQPRARVDLKNFFSCLKI